MVESRGGSRVRFEVPQIFGAAHETGEGRGGAFGKIVGRDVRSVEASPGLADEVASHQRDGDRFFGIRDDRDERVCHGFGGVHRRRRQDEENAVHVGVFEQDLQAGGVFVRRGVGEHIHGVHQAGRGRQDGAQFFAGGVGDLGETHAVTFDEIRRHDARSARVGEDGHASAGGEGEPGEGARPFEELLGAIGAQDTRFAERGGVGLVRACQCARVRGGGALSAGGASDFERDDGLVLRHLARLFDEALAIGQGLDVHGKDARVLVGGHQREQVGFGDVGLVAEADEARERESLLARPVNDRGAERARMRQESDVATRGKRRRQERCVERIVRVEQSDAVRAEDADSVLARDAEDFILQRRARGTDLAESARHDDRGTDAARAAIRERGGHCRGRDDQHGQIHGVGYFGDGSRDGASHDRPALGVDEMHRALVLTLDQVARHAVAEFHRVCGRAHDGNAARGEEGFDGHWSDSLLV